MLFFTKETGLASLKDDSTQVLIEDLSPLDGKGPLIMKVPDGPDNGLHPQACHIRDLLAGKVELTQAAADIIGLVLLVVVQQGGNPLFWVIIGDLFQGHELKAEALYQQPGEVEMHFKIRLDELKETALVEPKQGAILISDGGGRIGLVIKKGEFAKTLAFLNDHLDELPAFFIDIHPAHPTFYHLVVKTGVGSFQENEVTFPNLLIGSSPTQ